MKLWKMADGPWWSVVAYIALVCLFSLSLFVVFRFTSLNKPHDAVASMSTLFYRCFYYRAALKDSCIVVVSMYFIPIQKTLLAWNENIPPVITISTFNSLIMKNLSTTSIDSARSLKLEGISRRVREMLLCSIRICTLYTPQKKAESTEVSTTMYVYKKPTSTP